MSPSNLVCHGRGVYKRPRQHAEGGEAALVDRSSRPMRMRKCTPARVEKKVLPARRRLKRGAVVLAAELGMNPSTVGRILARHQVPDLAAIDPFTGQRVRCSRRRENRYEHPPPGAMIHVDVKRLGRIPHGGGWRLHGRSVAVKGRGNGYDYVHTAIDDHTRLAYSEVLADERDPTPSAKRGLDHFLTRYNTRRGHSALGGQPPISRLPA